jgi:hypothetical protein
MEKGLMEHFVVIEDPRRGRAVHDQVKRLAVVTRALLGEAETFVEIAEWARGTRKRGSAVS